MQEEAALFKVLSDATRLRLAALLAVHGETCVCELAQALEAPDFRISRHLAIMRAAGLVRARRQGTWMHYRLAEPRSGFETAIQASLHGALAEHPTMKADLARILSAGCQAPRATCKKERSP